MHLVKQIARRAILIRRTERGWEVNRLARQVVEQIQQEWALALGQERFTSLLGAAGLPELSTPARKRRSRVQQKPGG